MQGQRVVLSVKERQRALCPDGIVKLQAEHLTVPGGRVGQRSSDEWTSQELVGLIEK